MSLYESTFITRQDMSRGDITKLADAFIAIIEKADGKVIKNEYWGLKNLAYRVKKNRKGHYTMLGIDAPTEAVKEMERQMGLNEDVIRNVTIKVEELDDTPSVMMQQTRHSDDRSSAPRDHSSPRSAAPAPIPATPTEAPTAEETKAEAS